MFEQLGRQPHELRAQTEVPVGIAWVNVAKECAQQRQAALNVLAIAVPLQQGF
jgi:hypothetical protein